MILYVTTILVLAIISLWLSLLDIFQSIYLTCIDIMLGGCLPISKGNETLAVYDKGSVERAVGFGQFSQ